MLISSFLRILLFLVSCLLIISQSSLACSGYGYVDPNKNGDNVLIKNRDERPSVQALELHKPLVGNKYIGLFAKNKAGKFLPRAGINEKGLVVTSLSVSTVEKKNLIKCEGDQGLSNFIPHILTNYDSVESIKKDADKLFSNTVPVFYMIADKNEIIYVEISPKPEYKCNISGNTPNNYTIINQDKDGNIIHTNHYISAEFQKYNVKDYPSTYARFDRLKQLLSNTTKNNKIGQYLGYFHDETNGPNNSLFRYNIGKHQEKTLATLMVKIPRDGSPLTLDLNIYKKMLVDKETNKTKEIKSKHEIIILTPDKFESFESLHFKPCNVVFAKKT